MMSGIDNHEANERDRQADARDAEADKRDKTSVKESVEEERLNHAFETVTDDTAEAHTADRSDAARLRELSADDRAMAAEDRRQARIDRDRGASSASSVAADDRDVLAARRDAAAEVRDDNRSDRDQIADERDAAYSQAVTADSEHRVIERDQAASDRGQAAGDRENSAGDRDSSSVDRNIAAEVGQETRLAHERTIENISEREADALRTSRRDSLTGLPNRRELDRRLAHTFDGDSSQGFSPVLMFCDIDGFKQINDEHGHGAGDSALTIVGARFADTASGTDLVARVGGDEFVVVTDQPRTLPEALEYANQFRLAVSEPMPLDFPLGSATLKVTVSIGLASATHCLDAQQLLGSADMALHEAKASGRDRCVPYVDREGADPNSAL